ncbi:polyphenol oxidase family protein [Gemmatimonas sp.]|uniref:polyphenol oxidase family protein n=1 Tax=Gemmatimonas sp. TaxID=1962908 RepID=UPI00356297F6
MSLMPLGSAEPVSGMPDGVLAWTTTRADGTFGMGSQEPVGEVMDRWAALQDGLQALRIERLATAHQVHGASVERHVAGWRGWLRLRGVDGHVTTTPGTALAVTIADCTPVFIAHPGGAVAVLHAGWRGTAARILDAGLDQLGALGFPADECVVHLGPSICFACYEVGPEVLSAVYGVPVFAKGQLDVREVLREQVWRRGVTQISVSPACTRCHADRFFSHRGGDQGRQLGVIALQSS